MALPYSQPTPIGAERANKAKETRDDATEGARCRPQAITLANGEEADHGPTYPANFTKGLRHDGDGLLAKDADYHGFVAAINAPDPTLFDTAVETAATYAESAGVPAFKCQKDGKAPEWRGWESPRAGHAYDLQGPDAGAVGMAPAPRVGSSELAAEMAEVYGLAILRDAPFSEIAKGGGDKIGGAGAAVLTAAEVVDLLKGMAFYTGGAAARSSTPGFQDENGFNRFERNRRYARTLSFDPADLTPKTAFRGSTKGAQTGPYLSQFMLVGAPSRAGAGAGGFPGTDAAWGLADGFIPYGTLPIDQRGLVHKVGLDYMTDWCSWLDVQNGADFGGADQYEKTRRFITTPRDLATYVHFDALYEAYLNACLMLLALGAPASKGFPEPSPTKRRTPFATFGGPHVLSLVCEIATRCLKAVRRQKFNHHRRARPEALGGRLTVSALGQGATLGPAAGAFQQTLNDIPKGLHKAIAEHNRRQNDPDLRGQSRLSCGGDCPLPGGVDPAQFSDWNLLLPMAFPEGSPMHPAYGAGHATVAGGCVTILKAFFEMFDDADSGAERLLLTSYDGAGQPFAYEPDATGAKLKTADGAPLTLQGELDKLAANISIGRNMAGVHYYSDYYDSARMGERVAVGLVMEQATTYAEPVETRFTSFDGDLLTISGQAGGQPSLSVIDRSGAPIAPDDWWLRHAPGAERV